MYEPVGDLPGFAGTWFTRVGNVFTGQNSTITLELVPADRWWFRYSIGATFVGEDLEMWGKPASELKWAARLERFGRAIAILDPNINDDVSWMFSYQEAVPI